MNFTLTWLSTNSRFAQLSNIISTISTTSKRGANFQYVTTTRNNIHSNKHGFQPIVASLLLDKQLRFAQLLAQLLAQILAH